MAGGTVSGKVQGTPMLTSSLLIVSLLLGGAGGTGDEQEAVVADSATPSPTTAGAEEQRPRLLVPLYISAVALGVADVATSKAAIQRGAREANPIVASFQSDTWKTTTVRMAGVATTILCAEALRRRGHPRAAVFTMLAINAANVAIVIHNNGVNRGP